MTLLSTSLSFYVISLIPLSTIISQNSRWLPLANIRLAFCINLLKLAASSSFTHVYLNSCKHSIALAYKSPLRLFLTNLSIRFCIYSTAVATRSTFLSETIFWKSPIGFTDEISLTYSSLNSKPLPFYSNFNLAILSSSSICLASSYPFYSSFLMISLQ